MIHKLSSSKATGPDAISVKLLKMVSPVFSHPLPLIPEVFSRVRWGAATGSCAGRHVFGRMPKTLASHFLRLDRNRKPRMKSLWNPR